MLQSNMPPNERTRALLDSISPRQQTEEVGFGVLVNFAPGFLRRQYWVIILTAVLVLAASAIYLRITPPAYTAQAKVLYREPESSIRSAAIRASRRTARLPSNRNRRSRY